jgi:hypothetical protein
MTIPSFHDNLGLRKPVLQQWSTEMSIYVAIALAWAIAFSLMILIVTPSHAAGLPVPCLCGTWLLVVAWLGASACTGIGFVAAALFLRGRRP